MTCRRMKDMNWSMVTMRIFINDVWVDIGIHLRSDQHGSSHWQTQVRDKEALDTMRILLVMTHRLTPRPLGPFDSRST